MVAAAAAALFGSTFLLFGLDIFTVSGGSGRALDHAVAYADLLFAGIFSVWLFNILGSVVRGTGRMGVSAAAILLVTAVQVPLAGLLILGTGPFPALGIEGAAIATVAAYGIGAALITMVGANVGAGAITEAIGLAAALAPSWRADSFTTDPAVAEACRRYLQTVGPFYALFGLGLALYFASHGLRSMRWPMLGGVLRLTVIAARCGWLAGTGAMTFDALLLVVPVGMVSFGLFNALTLRRFAWRTMPNQDLGAS